MRDPLCVTPQEDCRDVIRTTSFFSIELKKQVKNTFTVHNKILHRGNEAFRLSNNINIFLGIHRVEISVKLISYYFSL